MSGIERLLSRLLPQSGVEWAGLAALTLFLSPRLIALPALLLAGWLALRTPERTVRIAAAVLLYITALASPVDVGFPGTVRGNPPRGFSVLPAVHGMPAHTRLIRKYGAYYPLGCAGRPGINQPRSVVVYR